MQHNQCRWIFLQKNNKKKKQLVGMPTKTGLFCDKDTSEWTCTAGELVLALVHSETICFLDSKISEHRHRFCEAFLEQRLIPKHYFLEHYPQLIKAFGPLVSLWTMQFFLSMLSDIHTLFETFFCPFQGSIRWWLHIIYMTVRLSSLHYR